MNLADVISNQGNLEKSYKPFIIAEAGVNHEANMDLAIRLIEEAKEGGADAIKFQSYKAETIASKNSPSYWDLEKEPTTSQYKLFKKYDSFWKKEFEELKNVCDKNNIEFLSTPFDIESSNFLNELMGAFKVSSSDMNNKPFIEHICEFGKPILLSTGASYIEEVDESVSWIEKYGNPLSLMHCILNYPCSDENANLGMITNLRHRYPNLLIGYSDHTLPKDMKTVETAVILGSEIIEKHFTFDKTLPGNDHYHAMDKNDLKKLINRLENIQLIMGNYEKAPINSEMISRKNARRSLVLNSDLQKDEIISKDCLTWKRPGTGIGPNEIDNVVGKRVNKNLNEDDIIHWEDLY